VATRARGWRRWLLVAGLALLGSAPPWPRAEEITPAWLSFDAHTQVVEVRLVAAANGANGTMNFNGYGNGDMTLVVPRGWRVNVEFFNQGLAALPHSLVVMDAVTPLPLEDGVPAFPRALTTRLVPGLEAGKGDSFSFVADKVGRYLLFCGVTGHGVAGMWDYLEVVPEAKAPRVVVKNQ
jgi:sulfocyanin